MSVEDNSHPVLTECLFRNNSATVGGAISGSDESVVVIRDCGFDGNNAETSGGACIFQGPKLDFRLSHWWQFLFTEKEMEISVEGVV